MPRTHSRTHFYKFASLQAARVIIETASLRWSSPLKFNDPFDTQSGLLADIDEHEFASRFATRMEELIFGDNLPPYFDARHRIHRAAAALRANRDALPRGEILEQVRRDALDIAGNLPMHLEDLSETLMHHMTASRVFCLTEEANNVVMWSHYADQHSGVCFRFRCLDDIDHPFLIARTVEYSDAYLSIGNSLQLADHFAKASPIDIVDLAWRAAFMKHRDWSYEREWRCHYPLINEAPGDGYTVQSQDPRLFEAVYLGCRMPDADARDLIDLVRSRLPNAQIMQARKSACSFALDFIGID